MDHIKDMDIKYKDTLFKKSSQISNQINLN